MLNNENISEKKGLALALIVDCRLYTAYQELLRCSWTAYSDLPNNRAANFIPMIGIKFAARLFGRSEYLGPLHVCWF